MKIKNYKSFFESISGTELVGHMGPNYGEQDNSPMKKAGMTDTLYSDKFGTIVTLDDYQNLYNDYLKKGGSPLQGFNLENLNKVLVTLSESTCSILNESFIKEEIQDVFQNLTSDDTFQIILKSGFESPPDHKNYLILKKDISKTDNFFFYYKDVKDEICHFVSYLDEKYYNCMIEKRWDDGKYGINPSSYNGKDLLTSVYIIYKD